MKYLYLSILFITLSTTSYAQKVEVLNFDQLQSKWSNDTDTLYVINYWATWCIPCVKELPDFIALDKAMEGEKFKMILVSLDFASKAETRVLPFINKHNISTEVVILDDDANVWIDKVNKDWDGAIPVTQFIKNNKTEFYNEELSAEQLREIVDGFD